jgi:hypothetical protein
MDYSAKEIGNKDLILVFFAAVSKDVGASNGLLVKAEDVIDGEDSGCSISGTRDIYSAYVLERVVCCEEASKGADMFSGHRGQCICPLDHSLLRQREGFCLMISIEFPAVALIAIALTYNKPRYVSTL